jgi:hypothetical protein
MQKCLRGELLQLAFVLPGSVEPLVAEAGCGKNVIENSGKNVRENVGEKFRKNVGENVRENGHKNVREKCRQKCPNSSSFWPCKTTLSQPSGERYFFNSYLRP